MNVLIMHYIDSASEGEKFVLQKFLKKRYDSISEDEISFWLTKIKNKGALEKSLKYLFDVSKRSIDQASKNNNDLQNIVQFVIKSIITRITKKLKKNDEEGNRCWIRLWWNSIQPRLKALGYDVVLLEKLEQLGGRARVFKKRVYF